MPITGGVALLLGGAILAFALPTASLHGIDLHVVGVILMLADALGLVLPRLMAARRDPNQPENRSRYDAMTPSTTGL